MKRKLPAAGVAMTLAASLWAAELDLSDFDDALMRSMDDAIKELDSNVGGQQPQDALANAAVLRDGLAWAEKYFAAKPQAPLGAGYAREGQEHLALVVQAIDAKDFDAASSGVRAVAKTCKACHQAYKPPD
jgi:cytochrome c556